MGYDMTIAKNRETLQNDKVHNAAKQALDSIRELLDVQREVGVVQTTDDLNHFLRASLDFAEYCKRLLDPGYFRLNNHGMGNYMEAMEDIGMMHESILKAVVDWESLPDPDDVGEEAYLSALDVLTGDHGDSEKPTLPSHKFSSNDGWWVTPEEITAALKVWTELPRSQVLLEDTLELIETDYWHEWIAYLERAAVNGGFRVF